MKHVFYYANIALFAWIVIGSCILFYYQNIDGTWNPPITFQTDQMALKTDKEIYRPGDTISIQNSICKKKNYVVHTTWKLVDDVVISFPDQGTRIVKVECVKDRWFEIGKIPQFASRGTNHLEAVAEMKINPLRTEYFNFRSQNFTVI